MSTNNFINKSKSKDRDYTKIYLKKITSAQCKADISFRSDEFKSIQAPIMINKEDGKQTRIDRNEYIQNLCNDIDNCDKVYYGSIPAPDDEEMIRMVIGKGGCYFYLTTVNTDILFIWHNRTNKNFEFWGQYAGRVKAAITEIEKRINIASNNKLQSLSKKKDEISKSNSIIIENIKYDKVKIGNTHYFVEDNKKDKPRVYSIVEHKLLGKYIGDYIEYDPFTKGPSIRLTYDNIIDNTDDIKNNNVIDNTDDIKNNDNVIDNIDDVKSNN
jgi:hypothetical protein